MRIHDLIGLCCGIGILVVMASVAADDIAEKAVLQSCASTGHATVQNVRITCQVVRK